MTGYETIITGVAGLIGGGGVGGIWGLFIAKQKQPSDMLAAQAAFQEALNKTQAAFTEGLERLVEHQQKELTSLRAEVARLSESESTCRAENIQLNQRVDSLERRLRAAHIDVPEPPPRPTHVHLLDHGEVVELFQEPKKP